MSESAIARKRTFLNMPHGFSAIYFAQLFSTLSFAVLYATLVLYMKQQIGFSTQEANILTGVYFAYNFGLHLLSGYIGGRFFSYRTLVIIGVISQLIGCLILSLGTVPTLYWGLACMLIGSGSLVTCLNMLLTQLYKLNESGRRESGFLWNYSSMNIGFFLGFTLAGYYQLSANFTTLFIVSSVVNLIAIIVLASQWKQLKDRNTLWSNSKKKQKFQRLCIGAAIIITSIPGLHLLLQYANISDYIILSIGVAIAIFLIYNALQHKGPERKQMFAFFILLLSAQMFWIVYQLAPLSLTIFAKYNVNLHLFGFQLAPGWIQNINSITICIGAPLLAIAFAALRKRQRALSIPTQFSTGLVLSGLGLLILPIGISLAGGNGLMAFGWLFITYVFQAVAELMINPISFSMVGKLIPSRWQSFYMGVILLNAGVAAVLASFFSNYAAGTSNSSNPLITNIGYAHAFKLLGWVTLAVALLVIVLTPLLRKLIQNDSDKIQTNPNYTEIGA